MLHQLRAKMLWSTVTKINQVQVQGWRVMIPEYKHTHTHTHTLTHTHRRRKRYERTTFLAVVVSCTLRPLPWPEKCLRSRFDSFVVPAYGKTLDNACLMWCLLG
jgi:hypothetical protein